MADVVQPDLNSLQIPGETHTLQHKPYYLGNLVKMTHFCLLIFASVNTLNSPGLTPTPEYYSHEIPLNFQSLARNHIHPVSHLESFRSSVFTTSRLVFAVKNKPLLCMSMGEFLWNQMLIVRTFPLPGDDLSASSSPATARNECSIAPLTPSPSPVAPHHTPLSSFYLFSTFSTYLLPLLTAICGL